MPRPTVLYKRERQILTIYITVVVVSFLGMILSNFLLPSTQEEILEVSGEAFKISLGALIGALSALLGVGRNE